MKKYRVADFFCGGGGFSEGFKLAGFEIIFAVDRWQPAVTTHHANHPNANTYLGDVIQISNLPDEEFHKLVPDTEVIIGSPPCTSFSNSNKSGKADKSLGIQLIEAYLRIIVRKKIKRNSILKHWVLENVPNVESYIKDEYSYKELRIPVEGKLRVKYPSSKVYNAKYFGVASNRKRYFCGDFPEPEQVIFNDEDVRTVNEVLKFLEKPKNNLEEVIKDPNYSNFQLKSKYVTDHHYIMEVADFEWKKAKRLKQDKGYMGKMSFPENLDKPSRTIMATMSSCARESIIYPYIPEQNRYRVPTVREIACIMSYPLDYRFYGKSKNIKYKLVGNSVPPKMSFAIAKSIAKHNNLKFSSEYVPIKFDDKALDDFINLNLDIFHLNIEKPKNATAKFKYHIPYLIINTLRVELTNSYSDFENKKFNWTVEIHRSQGPRARVYAPEINKMDIPNSLKEELDNFIKDFELRLSDFNTFQKFYCMTEKERKQLNAYGPMEVLDELKRYVDKIDLTEYIETTMLVLDGNKILIPLKICISYYLLVTIIIKMRGLTYGC